MIHKSNLLIVVMSMLTLASCKKDAEKKIPTVIQPEIMDSIFSNRFEGVIPCPDCPGIETTLAIHADSTLNKIVYYQDKQELPQQYSGTWKLKDSVFEANFDGNKEFYKIKKGSLLARVGSDRKEVIGKLAQDYLLERAQQIVLDSLSGTYVKGDSLSEPYQVLHLKHLKKDHFELKIILTGKERTAEFSANGTYNKENNQIEIPLKDAYPDLLGTLLIQFSKGKIHLTTKEKEHFEELKSFWDDTFSIQGTYNKE